MFKNTCCLAIAGLMGMSLFGCDGAENSLSAHAASPQSKIERGRYLADHVAMCTDCHTPRNETGQFITDRWLQGSMLDFQPVHEMPIWAPMAPPIAGLMIYSHDHVVTLLTTGLRPDGAPARPPMPQYKMTREDAEAIAAYLQSLGD